MSDASLAIKNGFEKVHPFAIKLPCHFHVKKAIKKRHLNNAVNKALTMENLTRFQMSRDFEFFEKGVALFKGKWTRKKNEFIKYMENTWP